MKIALLFLPLFVAGCVAPGQVSNSYGLTPGTTPSAQCLQAEMQRRSAMGAASLRYFGTMNRPAPAPIIRNPSGTHGGRSRRHRGRTPSRPDGRRVHRPLHRALPQGREGPLTALPFEGRLDPRRTREHWLCRMPVCRYCRTASRRPPHRLIRNDGLLRVPPFPERAREASQSRMSFAVYHGTLFPEKRCKTPLSDATNATARHSRPPSLFPFRRARCTIH